MRLVARFIIWAKRRAYRQRILTFADDTLFYRFAFLWPDEQGGYYRPPWYRPFNLLLHWWRPADGYREEYHDHPRWSVTVCLRGKIIERTPWSERTLTPGSIVIRSRKAIHSFEVPAGYRGKTWTLFIVGRRNYRQNTYRVTAQ